MKHKRLSEDEKRIIIDKGTEIPFTGKYENYSEKGLYVCKQCRSPLFLSDHKFKSNCGWPRFDNEINGAVKKKPDTDGQRTEILCNFCDGHLGHIFLNEGYTKNNIRHCVNSISIDFIPQSELDNLETAFLASGCFWGTQYYFQKAKGVVYTKPGYIGGKLENPTYEQVCSGMTNHAEAIMVKFDPKQISYSELLELFFETHNFSEHNRQGPDIGTQYRSEIFYTTETQKEIAIEYCNKLTNKGYEVATGISKATKFWDAEQYHQNYYQNSGGSPYCHIYRKLF